MKKIKGIFLILFAMSLFACKTSSDSDDDKEEQTTPGTTEVSGTEGSTDNPTKPAQGQTSSVKSAQYFWGIWQRMDNGDYYTIGESSVDFSDASYSITSAGVNFPSFTTLISGILGKSSFMSIPATNFSTSRSVFMLPLLSRCSAP